MKCNICGGDSFADQGGRKAVRCTVCGSLERTRILWLTLEQLAREIRIGQEFRVLHIAPERGIFNKLSEIIAPANYHTADIYPELFTQFAPKTRYIDLCSLEDWPSEHYDLILHSHVLEHTPCNLAYTCFHLHRMLREHGQHMFIVPFLSGKYDECFQDIHDDERVRRFGQNDHVRRFGKEDIGAHIGSILRFPGIFDAQEVFGRNTLAEANIPQQLWRGLNSSSVITLERSDIIFGL